MNIVCAPHRSNPGVERTNMEASGNARLSSRESSFGGMHSKATTQQGGLGSPRRIPDPYCASTLTRGTPRVRKEGAERNQIPLTERHASAGKAGNAATPALVGDATQGTSSTRLTPFGRWDEEGGAQTNMNICLIICFEILDMGSISPSKHEMAIR